MSTGSENMGENNIYTPNLPAGAWNFNMDYQNGEIYVMELFCILSREQLNE